MIDVVTGFDDEDAPTVEIRHWGGAMAHPGPGAGPVGHRGASYSLIVDREMHGLLPDSGSHLRELPRRPGRADTAYAPEDLRRLREVKRAYDPTNFFHLNANIRP